MFGKIVAISTVKHLSRNYASFSNQVCKSGIAYPLLVRHKIFRKGTPLTFMEMDTSCRTQDTKQKKSPSWCVMLTLKKNSCKSKFLFFKNRRKLWRCEDRIGFMPQTKSREKTVNMHKFIFQTGKSTFSAVQEFVMLRDSFIGIAVYQKIENVPWRLSPIKHSRFCVFVQVLRELFIPLIPPLRL